MREKLLCSCVIWLMGFLQSIDQPNQLLGRMGERNIVVLALSPFLGEVSGEGRIPEADIFGGVVKRVAQILRRGRHLSFGFQHSVSTAAQGRAAKSRRRAACLLHRKEQAAVCGANLSGLFTGQYSCP